VTGHRGDRLEAFLAGLYAHPGVLERFERDPSGAARGAGLAPDEVESVLRMDRAGLRLAAASVSRKRAGRRRRGAWQRLVDRLAGARLYLPR